MLIRQRKTTIRPPWNPDPYTITKVKGSQITATRGEEKKVRNLKKFKLLKERPADLRPRRSSKAVLEEDSDWDFDLKRKKSREEEAGPAGVGEPDSSFDEADYEITYRPDLGEEQQSVQTKEQETGKVYTRSGREVRPRQRLGEVEKDRLSPRNRKRKKTEAKKAQKEGRK